jgi:phospholipid/cholesterol/gamma-HCH transport system permease protein
MSENTPIKQEHMPRLEIVDQMHVIASGCWRVEALARPGVIPALLSRLNSLPDAVAAKWDLSRITAMDYIGAQLLWDGWGGKKPQQLLLSHGQEGLFDRLTQVGPLALPEKEESSFWSFYWIRKWTCSLLDHLSGLVGLVGQFMLDLILFARNPRQGPWKEISANIFHAGAQALGITAVVGFLIGIVLSFLSAQQLHIFGGDVYLVNILGMSIVRELGPMLAAILVAGRSGSSMTAQLGVMRVTEELDAMLVMGLPHGFRLILPKIIALAISMPLLVVWTDAIALIGGIGAARLQLGLSPTYFILKLPDAVPLANFWIGLGKGFVFGILIALVACHFGLRIKPNTESLGRGTTISVVTAITMVILADAVFAIIFRGVGFR